MTQHTTHTIETTYNDAIDRMSGMCYSIACHEDTNYADAPLISEIVRNTTVRREHHTMTHNPPHTIPEYTLRRVGADIIVTETSSISMFAIQQTTYEETDTVLLNYNEIDDLIKVLQAFQKAIKD